MGPISSTWRAARAMPFFRLVAIVQIALLARRHLGALRSDERRRLAWLASHPRGLSPAERRELRELAARLEPGAFGYAAFDKFSPIRVPRFLRPR